MKKIFSFAVVFIMITSLFAACGGDSDAVVTINGEAISKGEFEYYLLIAKNTILSAGGEDTQEYWSTTEIEGKNAGDVAKETALKNAIEHTLQAQKAVELGAKKTEKVRQEQRKNFIDQSFGGKEEDYLARIAELGLSDEYVTNVIVKDYLNGVLVETVELDTPTDSQIKDYYNNNYYRAHHILVSFSTYITETSDGRPEALAKINEVKEKLKSGESFEKLMAEYSEDEEISGSEMGYVFTKDILPKPFEDAVKNLKIGEISDIVETDYGYHIIKRFDAEEVYEEFITAPSQLVSDENFKGKDEISSLVEFAQFETLVMQWKDESDIKINDGLFDSIEVFKKEKEEESK